MAFSSVLSNGFTKIKGLFATSKGRGVAAGLILLVLLLVVLLLVTFAFPKPGEPDKLVAGNSSTAETQAPGQISNQQPVINTQSTETAVLDTDTVYINIYKYRDPFKPQVESSDTANIAGLTGNIKSAQSIGELLGNNGTTGNTTLTTTVGDSGSGGRSGSGGDAGSALSLKSITGQGASRQAAVIYQGQEYVVKEGDMIGGSSYLLAEINEGSVTVLNGDNRFTLQIGDEMVK